MESQQAEPQETEPKDLPSAGEPAEAGDQEAAVSAEEQPESVPPTPEPPLTPEPPPSTVDTPAEPEKEIHVPAAPPPEAPAVVEESRFRRAVRRVIRWGAGILLLFALGVLTATLVFYLPSVRQLRTTTGELERVSARVAQLEADIEAREEQLATLQAQLGQNQTDQANARIQINLLSAQLDIAEARLSLEREEASSALLALSQTPDTLESLAALVGADQLTAIESMQQRLELAISGIDSDPDAARSDLEVLANNLLKLEDAFALENN